MSELTPKMLWELIAIGPWCQTECLKPYADAWEADVRDWHADCLRLGDEVKALRKRLEAYDGLVREIVVGMRYGGGDNAGEIEAKRAALAGEQGKPEPVNMAPPPWPEGESVLILAAGVSVTRWAHITLSVPSLISLIGATLGVRVHAANEALAKRELAQQLPGVTIYREGEEPTP